MNSLTAVQTRINEIRQRIAQFAPPASADGNFAQILDQATPMSEAATGPASPEMLNLIQNRAQEYGVDANLVKAVVQAESGFNAHAVSPVGAQGLMQLMPGTSQQLGVTQPFDPLQNIDGGTRYLKGLLDKYQDVPKAVAAYNAGPGAVDKYNGTPPYAETQNYVKRVVGLYQQYNAEGGRL